MNIGEEIETFTIEPLENPIPEEVESDPAPEEPAKPEPTPEPAYVLINALQTQ